MNLVRFFNSALSSPERRYFSFYLPVSLPVFRILLNLLDDYFRKSLIIDNVYSTKELELYTYPKLASAVI